MAIFRWLAALYYVPLEVNVHVFTIGILQSPRLCQSIFHAFFVYLYDNFSNKEVCITDKRQLILRTNLRNCPISVYGGGVCIDVFG